jgi:hypothetical protein
VSIGKLNETVGHAKAGAIRSERLEDRAQIMLGLEVKLPHFIGLLDGMQQDRVEEDFRWALGKGRDGLPASRQYSVGHFPVNDLVVDMVQSLRNMCAFNSCMIGKAAANLKVCVQDEKTRII